MPRLSRQSKKASQHQRFTKHSSIRLFIRVYIYVYVCSLFVCAYVCLCKTACIYAYMCFPMRMSVCECGVRERLCAVKKKTADSGLILMVHLRFVLGLVPYH